MPTNPYLQRDKSKYTETNVYEDLIIEAIQWGGNEVFYIPRSLNKLDMIYGEDVLSSFDVAIPIEMYLENVTGFDGESEIISKFGLEIRDTASFVLSKRRFEQSIQRYLAKTKRVKSLITRPLEGDLVFLPLTKSFFQIDFVETDDPFLQLEKLFIYKLKASLFQFNNEDFNTGVKEIDSIIMDTTLNRLDYAITLEQRERDITPDFDVELNRTETLYDSLLTEDGGRFILEEYDTEDFEEKGEAVYGENTQIKQEFLESFDFSENNPFSERF